MTELIRRRIHRHVPSGLVCCDREWEAAYRRFETPEEEIQKFTRRFQWFGFDRIPRDIKIAEIFCGRGGGLESLSRMGFSDLSGVDLSEELLAEYHGLAELHLADCRKLPFDNQSLDAIVVQGGLHHLPKLPDDLDAVCAEARRVLRPDGRLYLVEPWQTNFLRFVHAIVSNKIVRRCWGKGDALATMTEREQVTYDQWLEMPSEILNTLSSQFTTERKQVRFGKLMWIGKPRPK